MPGKFFDIKKAMDISSEYVSEPNKPEEINRVKRVIAGARACSGPDETKMVLQMLGIIPTQKEGANAGSSDVHGDSHSVGDSSVD
jgi:hypothetical protein